MKDLTLNELESKLNSLWIARCKTNEIFLEFVARLDELGYTFSWSDDERKQFKIHKKGDANANLRTSL